MTNSPPVLLTIAGSDSSAGAGVQADIKTSAAHGVYATSVITQVTAQNTKHVESCFAVPGEILRAQCDAIIQDFEVDVIKIGMLGSGETVRALAQFLSDLGDKKPFTVLDPVLGSSSGRVFMEEEGISVLKSELSPLCNVITPNIEEAEKLLSCKIPTRSDMEKAVRRLVESGWAESAIITGGEGAQEGSNDVLYTGSTLVWLDGERVKTENSHGTGCTFSTSLACHIARGKPLPEAARCAKDFVSRCLQESQGIKLGKGAGPLFHGFIK